MKLPDRIDEALAGKPLAYGELARRLWPEPSAWRYANGGGPPGCYMALSAGLRRGGFELQSLDRRRSNASRLVYPRKAAKPIVATKSQFDFLAAPGRYCHTRNRTMLACVRIGLVKIVDTFLAEGKVEIEITAAGKDILRRGMEAISE